MEKFGIDISYWQKGYPYDGANKEGVKFAILRAGFRESKDSVFETHYSNAKRLGWGVGAYWYSYATTVEGARKEAQAFLKAVKGKKFEYPLYLDLEDKSQRGLGKKLLGEMVEAFGKVIEDAGYYFGVYTNLDWYRNVIDGASLNKRFDWWIAAWNSTKPSNVSYGLWQFGGSTNKLRSPKIAGVVTDQNYAYKDYPSIMKEKGLNGYSKETETKPDIPYADLTDEELAAKVWAGDFGNDPERKELLGSRYDAVQALVNKGVGKPTQSTSIKVGDKVEVINAINYDNGKSFATYYEKYDVLEVAGNRVVIGIGKTVTSAIDIKNIRKVG